MFNRTVHNRKNLKNNVLSRRLLNFYRLKKKTYIFIYLFICSSYQSSNSNSSTSDVFSDSDTEILERNEVPRIEHFGDSDRRDMLHPFARLRRIPQRRNTSSIRSNAPVTAANNRTQQNHITLHEQRNESPLSLNINTTSSSNNSNRVLNPSTSASNSNTTSMANVQAGTSSNENASSSNVNEKSEIVVDPCVQNFEMCEPAIKQIHGCYREIQTIYETLGVSLTPIEAEVQKLLTFVQEMIKKKEMKEKKLAQKELEKTISPLYSQLFLPVEIDFKKLMNEQNFQILKKQYYDIEPILEYEGIKNEMGKYKKSFWYLYNNFTNLYDQQDINNTNYFKQQLIENRKIFVENLKKSSHVQQVLNLNVNFQEDSFNDSIKALENMFDRNLELVKQKCQENSVIFSYKHLKNKIINIFKNYYRFLVDDRQTIVNYLKDLITNEKFILDVLPGQCKDTFYNKCCVIAHLGNKNIKRRKKIRKFFDRDNNFIYSLTKSILGSYESKEHEKIIQILIVYEYISSDELESVENLRMKRRIF